MLRDRPTLIQRSPTRLEIGVDFTMGVGAADIRRLTFVKTGSVTHSVNMDQRFIELPFTSSSGTLFVQMTDKVTEMPPGYYLMFAFNQAGVPSHGEDRARQHPREPGHRARLHGGRRRHAAARPSRCPATRTRRWSAFTATRRGTYVNRVGVRCIQVDQSGRWIGNPVNRGTAGTATGTAFTKTCARDFAISGYRGRASQFVDQLDFQCRALTSAGKVTGTVQYLGAVGGTGGTAQGPFSCSTSNPVYMLTGRSGSAIDAFGMQCRQAPITQVDTNTPPSLTNPGNQVTNVGCPGESAGRRDRCRHPAGHTHVLRDGLAPRPWHFRRRADQRRAHHGRHLPGVDLRVRRDGVDDGEPDLDGDRSRSADPEPDAEAAAQRLRQRR